MLYFLTYIFIGLIVSAIGFKQIAKNIVKQSKDKDEGADGLAILITFVLAPIIFVPLWPMFLTLRILSLIKKERSLP